jgi:hypothetical protein
MVPEEKLFLPPLQVMTTVQIPRTRKRRRKKENDEKKIKRKLTTTNLIIYKLMQLK